MINVLMFIGRLVLIYLLIGFIIAFIYDRIINYAEKTLDTYLTGKGWLVAMIYLALYWPIVIIVVIALMIKNTEITDEDMIKSIEIINEEAED